MRSNFFYKLVISILAVFVITTCIQSQTILLERGSVWKYLDDGSNQGTAWVDSDFDDSSWKNGAAELGYGDGDEATVISYGSNSSNKFTTCYFRHNFDVNLSDASPYILLQLLRDDGAVVYLNGREILRSNMPNGTITYVTRSAGTVAGSAEDVFYEFLIPSENLLDGSNVLAVSVHQRSASSSDVSFNLELSFSDEEPALIRKEPYLIFSDTKDEMQVFWQLYQSASCFFEWGDDLTYQLGSENTREYGDDHQHFYLMTGLVPGTEYHYRMIVEEDTITGKFRSAPEDTIKSLTFFAYGDTRSKPEHHNDVAEQILKEIAKDEDALSFVISAGDLVYNGNLEEDWDNEFFSGNYSFIRQMMQMLPYVATVGNHDGNGDLFEKYFPFPQYQNGDYYWSFDYGPAHFTIIDQFSTYTRSSKQYNWLVDDLANSDKQWKFILMHEPGWSAGGMHANNVQVQELIQPLCKEYGVQFVLTGHNHYYSCAVVDGVVHITTGGGGAPLHNPDLSYPNIVKAEKNYHFCKIKIDDSSLHFTAINDLGNIIHEFNYNEFITDISDIDLPASDLLIAPNPFSNTTKISFGLEEMSKVKILVYNPMGSLIATLADNEYLQGTHYLNWNGYSDSGHKAVYGLYYVCMETAEGEHLTKKLILRD